MAESKSLDELSNRLKTTIYNEVVSRVEDPSNATKLELAFREHLASIHYSLIGAVPKPGLVEAYYLKYIVANLKIILKGKAVGKSYEELSRYVHLYPEELAGRRDLVISSLSAGDLNETAKLLRDSEFGEDIDSAIKTFGETGRTQVFDMYLDKAIYSRIIKEFYSLRRDELHGIMGSESAKVNSLVSVDLDMYNVLAVLRAKIWDLEPRTTRELVVKPTFQVSEDVLRSMIETESLDDAIKQLARTEYRHLVPSGAVDENAIAKLEEGFNSITYKKSMAPFLWDVFGMSVVMGIIKLKELEKRNLTAIAYGVEAKMGFQKIMPKVIFVK